MDNGPSAFFGRPEEAARRRPSALSCKEQTRLRGMRRRKLVVCNNDRRAKRRHRVKFRREIHRETHTARGSRVAPASSPREARCRSTSVAAYAASGPLLQHGENSGGSFLALLARAHRRASDAHAVPIDRQHLVRQADKDDHRGQQKKLWMPNVITRLEFRRERFNRPAFRMARGSLTVTDAASSRIMEMTMKRGEFIGKKGVAGVQALQNGEGGSRSRVTSPHSWNEEFDFEASISSRQMRRISPTASASIYRARRSVAKVTLFAQWAPNRRIGCAWRSW